jgi:hypothetical protein
MVSSGNDQRVKLWGIHLDSFGAGLGGVDVRKLANKHTIVADVSDLAVISGSKGFCIANVVICGVGMEVWKVKNMMGVFKLLL